MGKLIDTGSLELDAEWDDYYDTYMAYSQLQIREAEEVKAIRLEKVIQARNEIENLIPRDDGLVEMWEVLEILDKLIENKE